MELYPLRLKLYLHPCDTKPIEETFSSMSTVGTLFDYWLFDGARSEDRILKRAGGGGASRSDHTQKFCASRYWQKC